MRAQVDELSKTLNVISKNNDFNQKNFEITFEEGSLSIFLILETLTVATTILWERFGRDYIHTKKIENLLAKEKIKSVEFINNEDEALVKLVLGNSQNYEITISKNAYEAIKNEKVAKSKKKLAKQALYENRKIKIGNENNGFEFDDFSLESIANGKLISEKVSDKPLVKKGNDNNAVLIFKKFNYDKKNDKSFVDGEYKKTEIRKINYNNTLDDFDLLNDYEPFYGVNGSLIECEIDYTWTFYMDKAWYEIEVLKIKKIKRPEGGGRQLTLEESVK